MKIKKATQSDIPEIISVLKESLGEGLLQKTALIWHFKHFLNPFGKSVVLVAEEDNRIIGVRAFMQWKWQLGKHIYKAYRAVDTATHPKYQGQGVFKKLTLAAIELVQKDKDSFIFNTPNDKSRPGYLKMGWIPINRIKLTVVPTFIYTLKYLFNGGTEIKPVKVDNLKEICEKHNANLSKQGKLFTPKSHSLLKWRYQENPLQYYTIFKSENWYVALYVKKHRFFNELRIAEVLGVGNKNERRQVQKIISSFAKENKCKLMSISERKVFKCGISGKFGPVLTFNPLQTGTNFIKNIGTIENWQYSLGDLELF